MNTISRSAVAAAIVASLGLAPMLVSAQASTATISGVIKIEETSKVFVGIPCTTLDVTVTGAKGFKKVVKAEAGTAHVNVKGHFEDCKYSVTGIPVNEDVTVTVADLKYPTYVEEIPKLDPAAEAEVTKFVKTLDGIIALDDKNLTAAKAMKNKSASAKFVALYAERAASMIKLRTAIQDAADKTVKVASVKSEDLFAPKTGKVKPVAKPGPKTATEKITADLLIEIADGK